jgi:hypothetical protein
MAGGTATNYTYYYQIDKNDGNWYSALSSWLTATTLGTSLSGITGTNASKWFKLKLTITTSTTNATAITSVYLTTTSTTTAQDYQYPLDTASVTITGLISWTEIHAYLWNDPNTATQIAVTESSWSSFSFSQSYSWQSWYITLIKAGVKYLRVPITYIGNDVEIPVFQLQDLAYNNI